MNHRVTRTEKEYTQYHDKYRHLFNASGCDSVMLPISGYDGVSLWIVSHVDMTNDIKIIEIFFDM